MKKICIPVENANAYENYRNALAELGVRPVLITEECDYSEFDGLLLPGGADIDPSYYHQEIDGSVDIDKKLDELQFKVLDGFIKLKKPVFGICRGHQLLNVYFGGTLFQDIKEKDHHRRIVEGIDNINTLTAYKDTFLNEIYGDSFVTNSSHHQAADIIGKGLKVAACCDDGVVEALAHETLPVWSVQFHPERMCFDKTNPETVDGSKVIAYFLDKC